MKCFVDYETSGWLDNAWVFTFGRAVPLTSIVPLTVFPLFIMNVLWWKTLTSSSFCWISLEGPNFSDATHMLIKHTRVLEERVRREHRRDVISFEHVLFWPCWHVACVPASSQCKQTGCLACVTQKAHSNEMRPSQRQLSASRLNKCNDDVSPNRVIIPYVKRMGNNVSHRVNPEQQQWRDGGHEWASSCRWRRRAAAGGVNWVVSEALMCFDVEV